MKKMEKNMKIEKWRQNMSIIRAAQNILIETWNRIHINQLHIFKHVKGKYSKNLNMNLNFHFDYLLLFDVLDVWCVWNDEESRTFQWNLIWNSCSLMGWDGMDMR